MSRAGVNWCIYGTEEKTYTRASDVVQQVKVSAVKTWQPEFKPLNWNKSGMRELTPWT